MGPADFDTSWRRVGPRLTALVAAAQLAAARSGSEYVPRVLAETGQNAAAAGEVQPRRLAGVASDGRPLDSLLYGSVVASGRAYNAGADADTALASGAQWLDMTAATMIADAGRVAAGAAMVARPTVTGYVRMLNPPSCSRCAVLAGVWYRYNAGFERHPGCDCVHIPASEDMAGDLRTDPDAYFKSLSGADQDRIFTKTGAQAVRDGADLGQVVNARRGATGLTPAGARITADEARLLRTGRDVGHLQTTRVYGRDVFTTTEGTTVRGLAGKRLGNLTKVPGQRYRVSQTPRLMPESIYEIAGDNRAEAIRLLKRFGYIT